MFSIVIVSLFAIHKVQGQCEAGSAELGYSEIQECTLWYCDPDDPGTEVLSTTSYTDLNYIDFVGWACPHIANCGDAITWNPDLACACPESTNCADDGYYCGETGDCLATCHEVACDDGYHCATDELSTEWFCSITCDLKTSYPNELGTECIDYICEADCSSDQSCYGSDSDGNTFDSTYCGYCACNINAEYSHSLCFDGTDYDNWCSAECYHGELESTICNDACAESSLCEDEPTTTIAETDLCLELDCGDYEECFEGECYTIGCGGECTDEQYCEGDECKDLGECDAECDTEMICGEDDECIGTPTTEAPIFIPSSSKSMFRFGLFAAGFMLFLSVIIV